MVKSLFISFEGSDGSGKSTQINYVREYFDKKGYKTLLTREPGGTPIGEKIREILLDKGNLTMTDMTETLLYAAARAQHVEEIIKPALRNGIVVICDRFIDSSLAYQGYGRNLLDFVESVNAPVVSDCIPDITFLLKVNPNISKKRIEDKEKDRLEIENEEFYSRVYKGYEELENRYRKRIVAIDGTLDIDLVRKKIEKILDKVLE